MPDRILSEAELIERYLAPLARGCPGAAGLADDAASLEPPPGADLVLTTDAVAAGVHFFPDDVPGDIAWKALAVNVSDLAAKGATPLVYQMALSFPEPPEHAWLERFAAGLAEAQAAFGIVLSGGDTDRRPGPLTIAITAVGSVPSGTMVRRGTARPGDCLFVSGTLGDGALGLKLRTDPAFAGAWGLGGEECRELVDRYLRPRPRLVLGAALRSMATASIDVSDGLAKDLGHMVRASGCGATVETARLPLSGPARKALAADNALMASLVAGGDDYEILAAVASGHAAAFETEAASCGCPVTRIGTCEAGSGVALLDSECQPLALMRHGWDHF